MSRADDQRVADMLMAADEIGNVVERGRPAFDTDVVLRRAMERSLEIVGEAAKSLSDEFTSSHPTIPVSDLAKSATESATTTTASIQRNSGRSPPSTYRC